MIYTKTGDKGTTSLVGGARVQKSDIRVETYGTADELNSYLGLVAELIKGVSDKYYNQIKEIQNELFVVQTILATEDPTWLEKLPQLPRKSVVRLEESINEMTAELPKNKAFIIPGGSLASAHIHVARTICRRTERCCVALNDKHPIPELILQYINRLSDYLFTLSRIILKLENQPEHFWQAPK